MVVSSNFIGLFRSFLCHHYLLWFGTRVWKLRRPGNDDCMRSHFGISVLSESFEPSVAMATDSVIWVDISQRMYTVITFLNYSVIIFELVSSFSRSLLESAFIQPSLLSIVNWFCQKKADLTYLIEVLERLLIK